MILHLLQQSGIRGHVEGEYLQGGIGELPAAGLVNVVVEDDEQAERARAVIREWESTAPQPSPAAPAGRAPLAYFAAGALLGAAAVWMVCRAMTGL